MSRWQYDVVSGMIRRDCGEISLRRRGFVGKGVAAVPGSAPCEFSMTTMGREHMHVLQ